MAGAFLLYGAKMKIEDIKIGMKVCYGKDITDVYTVVSIDNDELITVVDDDDFGFDLDAENVEIFDPEQAKIIITDIQNNINQANSHLEKAFQALLAVKQKAKLYDIDPYNKEVLAWENLFIRYIQVVLVGEFLLWNVIK